MIWRWLVNALAVAAATFLVPGIYITDSSVGAQVLAIVAVAAVLGALNAVVKPLLTVLTGCLVVLTFGLFLIVINAIMLLAASGIMSWFGGAWHVDGFWPAAVLGSLVISLVSLVLGIFDPDRRRPAASGTVERYR
ncbi:MULTISPECIES: phage holin family protein [Kocuria]|uniref:Phage holin family protein n=1 Tax=Kocuria subflava TaxID=1736139 RepID=A0A846TU00_9MICC|nr:phage holin family protein [Kocuria sp. CPCC 104605]NKE09262.1 phage holin family protein [Kocuria subflava]